MAHHQIRRRSRLGWRADRLPVVCVCLLAMTVAAPPASLASADVVGIGSAGAELVRRVETRSPTARALLAALRTSGAIVLVLIEPRLSAEGLTTADRTTGVARIVIRLRRHADPDEMIPWLAHELQHAVEIAAAGAGSAADVRRLYERIGFVDLDGRYETQAAIDAGERARADLLRSRPPTSPFP